MGVTRHWDFRNYIDLRRMAGLSSSRFLFPKTGVGESAANRPFPRTAGGVFDSVIHAGKGQTALFNGSILSFIVITQRGGVIQHLINSSFLALAIYGSLLVLSILSWGIMIKKYFDLRKERKLAKGFRRLFNELEGNIVALSQEGILPANSPARLFVSAYEELRLWATLDRDQNRIIAERPVVPALERTLDRAIEMEKERWERGTTFLATIASVSPLMGLLGTVWGVFLSFQEMGTVGATSLETVAPGISEALLTTVGGLLVAIPAVFGHNWILRAVRSIETQLETFASEIINHFDRQIVVGSFSNTSRLSAPRPVSRRRSGGPA